MIDLKYNISNFNHFLNPKIFLDESKGGRFQIILWNLSLPRGKVILFDPNIKWICSPNHLFQKVIKIM